MVVWLLRRLEADRQEGSHFLWFRYCGALLFADFTVLIQIIMTALLSIRASPRVEKKMQKYVR